MYCETYYYTISSDRAVKYHGNFIPASSCFQSRCSRCLRNPGNLSKSRSLACSHPQGLNSTLVVAQYTSQKRVSFFCHMAAVNMRWRWPASGTWIYDMYRLYNMYYAHRADGCAAIGPEVERASYLR